MILRVLIVLLITPTAFCLERMICPSVEDDQYPALVYTHGDILKVTYWDQDHFEIQDIMDGCSSVTPVGDGLYFAASSNYRRLYNYHIVNLVKGRITRIEHDEGLRHAGISYGECILFFQSENVNDDMTFYRLDLNTLELQPITHFTHQDHPNWFNDLTYRFNVSPDCRYIASIRYRGDRRDYSQAALYELSITDVKTQTTTVIDDEVGIAVNPISSNGRGVPPFEWLDRDELLYLDMDMKRATYWDMDEFVMIKDISSTLRIATVSPQDILVTGHGDYDLPLTLSGGEFLRSGTQIFYNHMEVDRIHKKLVPRQEPQRITYDRDKKETTVQFYDQTVYQGGLSRFSQILSPSTHHLAFVLHDTVTPYHYNYHLFIARKDAQKPFPIVENNSEIIRLVEWLE